MGGRLLELREATDADAAFLSTRLRPADVEEVWAAACLDPYGALSFSLKASSLAMAACQDGEPVALFGVCDLEDSAGQLWMLASEVVAKRPRPFLRTAKVVVSELLQGYESLTNFVDLRHLESFRLLSFLGALYGEPVPYGPLGRHFVPFTIRRYPCA